MQSKATTVQEYLAELPLAHRQHGHPASLDEGEVEEETQAQEPAF